MWLQAEGAPDARDSALRETGLPRHGARGPVRGVWRRAFQSSCDDLFDLHVPNLAGCARAGLIAQPFEPLPAEALAPLADGGSADAQSLGHRLIALPAGAGQHDTRPQGQRLGGFAPARPLLQFLPL
jgi:hypothetical protein